MKLIITLSIFLLMSCTSNTHNKNWIPLFNGKDLSGWVVKFNGFPAGHNLQNTFRVEQGMLTVNYDNWHDFDAQYGHIFTEQSYKHYRIRLLYRFISKQVTQKPEYNWAYRNNGVMLHSQSAESMGLKQEFPMSVEAQLLGGNGEDERATGNMCSPSTHIVWQGKLMKKHCIDSSSITYHGDQWVKFEAEVNQNGTIKHFINDHLVFEYSSLQVDPENHWGKRLLASGTPILLTEGHIALQAETHPIQFKSIEIQYLPDH